MSENLPDQGETCPQRELNQTDSSEKNLTKTYIIMLSTI